MSNLTPNYRDIDFQTMVARLRTLLSNTDTFRDYDFEGANITILMELVSYVGDLNTYFTNKLAQNIHTETANVYEVVHSLVRQQGHEPSGYVGAELVVGVRVYMADGVNPPYYQVGDELSVPQWFKLDTERTTDAGEKIYYILTEPYTYQVVQADVSNGYLDIQLTLRQGTLTVIDTYTGLDIVSNQIILPFQKWDMSTYPYDESPPSVQVLVGNGETSWTRINDFFDDISGLVEENNAYMLLYDKYQRSVLTFSNTRNIPELTDPIVVYLLETLGLDGAVSSRVWSVDKTTTPSRWAQENGTVPDTDTVLDNDVDFLTNNNTGKIPTEQYVVYNDSGSSGGSNPQSIDELKEAGKYAAGSQQRNVTKKDYIGSLERRGDITVANAWGEQEENPNTLVLENYNKAYISIIPAEWENGNDNNVLLNGVTINNSFSRNLAVALQFPAEYTLDNVYNPAWEAELLTYLEPRKMLGIYEVFVLPELVHFRFDFGLKVRRSYNWTQVKEAVKSKLNYYFQNSNREFGEIIDFREIVEYILDVGNTSPTDDFALVRGVQYLTVRDIMTYRDTGLLESTIPQDACEHMDGIYGSCSDSQYDNQIECEDALETWTVGPCSIDASIDEMYVYPENIYNYFPHYVELGYAQNSQDTTYNDLQPIRLGHKQFPQIAIDLCVFTNEG